MTEKLLHFIWQYKLFDFRKVNSTTQNQLIEILKVGSLNSNAGPDFEGGKIKIGDTIWVGNIELHVNASDWIKHKHSNQKNYNTVIAHVVYNADAEIKDHLNNFIPCIELKNAINSKLLKAYENLMQNTHHIACSSKIGKINEIVLMQQWDRVLVERLTQKSAIIQQLLQDSNNNWSEVFYLNIAKVFGGNINGDAFMSLTARLPLKVLSKHKNNLIQIEALLFGIAGLIPNNNSSNESYISLLQREFDFLQKKYSLQTMETTRWKFMRMRPHNFPSIRISQFANLIHQSSFLFSAMIERHLNIAELLLLFKCKASEFWNTCYMFYGNKHTAVEKKIGVQTIQNILINAVAPTLYVYGKQIDSASHYNNAIQLLLDLPAEQNKITRLYSSLNLVHDSAFFSQAYIQQFKNYCSIKNCLNCSIGFCIINSNKN
jgi:hypothetical protein